ncbi:SAM-dependent methyltransferase [Chromatium okenii]|uniref:class I SAM-dependent methyltransferase n=1 Tax=Chromatium okenii TaxID=61644 RepID=UPI001908D2A4|nr:class I SAM-dependent methyltransferase [Chromatium okenii]MBK1641392.1 SAM-dependent methyltransferase [Chromatium okenii]
MVKLKFTGSEFDKFADEYRKIHSESIRISGEEPEFFAQYKVVDTANLSRQLNQSSKIRILDFGSGVGGSVLHFREQFPDCDLVCLDVSEKSLSLASEKYLNKAQFASFDGINIPFPDMYFDLVFSACVFHHINHVEHLKILCELNRVLRTGGLAIIFEHNPLNPFTVRTVNRCPFDENAVLIPATQLRLNMIDAGFQEVLTHYRIFFPKLLRSLRWLETYLKWLPLGAQYYVAARKT